MVNLLGWMPARAALLKEKCLFLHDYGKEPRPGRKLGHCTLVAQNSAERDRRAASLLRRLDSRKIPG